MLENNQKEIVLLEDLGMLYPKVNSKYKVRYGLYKCYCGNEFKTTVQNIKGGYTKSCGCWNKKMLKERKNIHHLTNHRVYKIWDGMKQRCNNKNNAHYKDYGERNISVCNEWENNFLSFYNWSLENGYKDNLTIDRENNDLGYHPNNCRWVERTTQSRNTRIIHKHNTSGYRGVSFSTRSNKWLAQIMINNKNTFIGYFNDIIDAAKAYDKYVIDNNLEHTTNGL